MNAHQWLDKVNLKAASVKEVPESFSSTVYNVKLVTGETVFLKIPRSVQKLSLEREMLERFKGHLPVPEVVAFHEDGFLVLEALDGVPATGMVSEKLAWKIGELLARLHTIRVGPEDYGGAVRDEFSRWTEFLPAQFYSFAEDAKKVLDPELFDLALVRFEEMRKELPPPDGPSFIHMDFRPGNILVRDDHVTGLIDFESVRIGSTELDFTKIERDVCQRFPGTREAFEDGYRSVRPLIDLDRVLPFYRMTDAFNSTGWCQRMGLEKNRDFFERNVKILKEGLA
ncbi:phosphotransferase family protein [Rossellomorea marisflavi]|uniref:phosphotransferase family protein n=1 Tax=Rossellomorea marisflavi TaxID=189381 RepID=UPI00064E46C0|nr:aminoglycoside phosphotransferase family protein [Rossellomorea marisflavi]KMK92401.1 phosphotransferase [Rossellomorea marisflavi]MCM2603185.1 aminoglycoside phosphotransferase family protein [Rossellomorea marisflavi]